MKNHMSTIWLITCPVWTDDDIGKKRVLKCFDKEDIALEAFHCMYMKEILGRNVFGSFTWEKELECYNSIIDAVHHTPIKKYFGTPLRQDVELNWTFSNAENTKLHKQFLHFLKSSK